MVQQSPGNNQQTHRTLRWVQRKGRTLLTGKFWLRRLPILFFLRGYDVSCLLHDVIAGLTVALTVIPQCMAIAVVAGLSPQYGLYSSFMGCFVYIFLGSVKEVTIGPTLVIAMLTKPFVDKFGPEIAIFLCFASGCFITLLAVLNLGFLVDFISAPVLAGFMSAASLSIISGQVPALLGIPGGGATFLEYWLHIVENVHQTRLWDTVLGVSCIAVLVVLQYIYKFSEVRDTPTVASLGERVYRGVLRYLSLGRNAIVVIVSTAIVASLMTSEGEPPVGVAGEVKEGLPAFQPPPFEVVFENRTLSFGEAASQLSPAIVVPILMIIEIMATTKVFAHGKTVDASQEMIAVGVSNILGSFIQSMPVTASITRSVINSRSGVRTPLGGLLTGNLVLLALALLTSTLQYLPNATLAAVIIVAISSLTQIHNDTITLWHSKKSDLIPLYIAFLGSLFIGLDYGIIIGITSNLLLIVYQAARPLITVENIQVGDRSVLLVTPDRSVTYPAAEHVKKAICKAAVRAGTSLLVVVNGHHVNHVDSTAVKVLISLLKEFDLRHQKIVFWNWKKTLRRTFVSYDKIDPGCFHEESTLEALLASLNTLESEEVA